MEEEKDFSKSYEQKQDDLILEIGRAFKDYDEEGTEKLLLEYEKNVDERNKELYSKHREETKGEKVEERITEIQDKKEPQETDEILQEIERNIEKQPQSIKDMYEEVKKDFFLITENEDYRYLWTKKCNNKIMSWYEDKNNPGVWKARFLRYSNSDFQWKSLPGYRENGSFMKGDEKNSKHHYVQSAKLHKDIYKILNYIPIGGQIDLEKYIPTMKGKYGEDVEFRENYQEFNKESWRDIQQYTNFYHYWYENLNSKNRVITNQNFYQSLEERAKKSKYSNNIKQYIDTCLGGNKDPNIWFKDEKFKKVYADNISNAFEEIFTSINYPEDMQPDFSKEGESTYIKNEHDPRKPNINIEEYRVKNDEGDEIIFAMAHDSQGRVYIDNIYDPRVGFNSYGTLNEIVRMGYLVYKPEDYKDQAIGFSDKYKGKENGSYVEINKLWENDPIIKKYKESLTKRGILKIDK